MADQLTSERRFTQIEIVAIKRAKMAESALASAISGYVVAGFGSCVTDPLREALKQVQHSLREVQS